MSPDEKNINVHISSSLISKLDIKIKVIKYHHQVSETVFTMSPDEKNIINVPKPYKRLKLLSFEELTFHLTHKYVYIRSSKLSAYWRC